VVTAGHNDVGTSKTALAELRVRDIEPRAQFRAFPALTVDEEHPLA